MEDQHATEDDEKAAFEVEMTRKILPSNEIRWTFNGRKIDIDDIRKYSMEIDNKLCRLIIRNVKLEDEGSYAVEVNGSRSSANFIVNGNLKNMFICHSF